MLTRTLKPESQSKKSGKTENGGKNSRNGGGTEATVVLSPDGAMTVSADQASQDKENQHTISLPYYYFGIFDGHAGWGAAVSASNQLHHLLHVR